MANNKEWGITRKLQDYGIIAVNVNFCAMCNLKCSYCFLPKSKNMYKENQTCIDWITSGRMEDEIGSYNSGNSDHDGSYYSGNNAFLVTDDY